MRTGGTAGTRIQAGAFCVIAAMVLLAPAPSHAQARVYYGSLQGATSPAEITARVVLEATTEYRTIRERGLTGDDPEYWILINRANAKFYPAVGRAARAHSRDVVVEQGTADLGGNSMNLTQAVINALEP